MIRNRPSVVSILMVCGLIFVLPAPEKVGAAVVIDNSLGTPFGGTALAFGGTGNQGATVFTMGGTSLNLDSIEVSIRSNNASAGDVSFAIHADNGAGTAPGAQIENLGSQLTTNVDPSPFIFQTFNSGTNPLLTANTTYWIVGTELADPPGGGTGNPGWLAYSNIVNSGTGILNGGVWHNTGGGLTDLLPAGSLALRVNASAIPEPSAFLLLGLVALGGIAYRRKQVFSFIRRKQLSQV